MRSNRQFVAFSSRAFAAGIGFAGLLIGGSVLAEETANAAATTASQPAAKVVSRKAIEEITVTARRQSENLQEVPVAVTAFTEADITRVAPRTLRDFDGLAPNVRIGMNTAGPNAGAIFIRGIGYADIEKTQTPAVSVVLDGVQQGSSTGQLIDGFDLAQIEILRGPQGVLQGKNTTGGAIIVNRTKPNLERTDYALSGQYGRYNEGQLKGRISFPIVDNVLALKIGGIYKRRDGYWDNTTLNSHPGKIDYSALTMSALWQPYEGFTSQLTFDKLKDRSDIPPQDPRIDGRNPFKNASTIKEPTAYDVRSLTWNNSLDLGFIGTLTSVTGASQNDDTVTQAFDGSTRLTAAVPIVALHTLRAQRYKQFSEELKLNGTLFLDNLHYTAGVYYFHTSQRFAQGSNQILQLPGVVLGLPPNTCLPVAGILPNPNPAIGSALCQIPSFAVQRSKENVKSEAAFAALNYNVTDRIEISAGMRRLAEEKDFSTAFGIGQSPGGKIDAFGFPLDPPKHVLSIFPGFPVTGNHGWKANVYRFSGSWNITDENKLYASYATGFRSGGYSIRGTDPAHLSFDPEDVKSYEIGSKNQFFDGRVRLNLAAFSTVLQGAQFSSILTNAGAPATNTLILNATGDFKVYGAEMEAIWAVTDELTLQATYGYQHTKGEGDSHDCLVRPFNASGTGCNKGENPTLFNTDGSPKGALPQVKAAGSQGFAAPKFNWALTGQYATTFGGNPFTASITGKYTDDIFLFALPNAANVPTAQFVKGYLLVDANVSYEWRRTDKDSITFSLTGKNLLDKDYVEQELPLGNGGFRGWGPPRQVAIEVLWRS